MASRMPRRTPSVQALSPKRAWGGRRCRLHRGRSIGLKKANVAELVDALDLGSSGATRESSSLSFRTTHLAYILCSRRGAASAATREFEGASMQVSVENRRQPRAQTHGSHSRWTSTKRRCDRAWPKSAAASRLKGFRPGKIPPKVIEQRFGAQIRGEAISELIRNSFQQAVGQENLRPAMAPQIDTTGRPDNGQIEYTATLRSAAGSRRGRRRASSRSTSRPRPSPMPTSTR